MQTTFWKNKKVFMTGHTGFKGSWLSLWLQSAGADLAGYAFPPPTLPNLYTDAVVEKGMESHIGDILDSELLKNAVAAHQPDIVIHMAAQTVVRTSYEYPVETFATNVMGTVSILEAVRAVPAVKVFVNVTTDKCYENKELNRGYCESDPLGGFDPYSSSKACSELVTAAYRKSFYGDGASETAIATARAGNVIGGGDWTKNQLIPDIFRALLMEQPVRIRNPRSIRPWQFVMDSLDGYLTLAEHLWENGEKYSESWNFGPKPDGAKSVDWIAGRIVELWGRTSGIEIDSSPQPHETGILLLDSSKSEKRLDWRTNLSLPEALEWTVEWYNAYQNRSNIREITMEQIERYVKLERR